MFGKTWNPATATVIDSRVVRVSAASEHGPTIQHEYILEVAPPDGPPAGLSSQTGTTATFGPRGTVNV